MIIVVIIFFYLRFYRFNISITAIIQFLTPNRLEAFYVVHFTRVMTNLVAGLIFKNFQKR